MKAVSSLAIVWLIVVGTITLAASAMVLHRWRLMLLASIVALPISATFFFSGRYWYDTGYWQPWHALPWLLLLGAAWLQFKQRPIYWIVLAVLPWAAVNAFLALLYTWAVFVYGREF
ncbi:MAG: hypothetical protein ACH37Z_19335 [Anaerolineae bacterium]